MSRNARFASSATRFPILAGLLVIVSALASTATERIRFTPKFTQGQTLRYQIDTRTTTTGKTTTPIVDPEGGSKASETISLLVRLDVLEVTPGIEGTPDHVRLSATYEKSWAHTERDAFDPQTPSLEEQYARLAGHSIEFTIGSRGQPVDFNASDDILLSRSEANPTLSWVNLLPLGSEFPRKGIVIGQKWGSERPLAGLPLTGLLWRSESAYLRNEPCHTSSAGVAGRAAAANLDTCAIVLTRFEILRRGGADSDATPEDYRRNGLRTSGTWKGSGERLDSISIPSGLLVNSTQTSTQDMDYQIVSANTGSAIHQVASVQGQSEVTLLP
jgi:hypothetical protein